MKRFLTLFLAVLMVVLAVPVMTVSADDTPTAVWTNTAASIDGTKDAAYSGAGVPVGDNATAYFAFDMTAIYVFVDVADATKSDAYYSKVGDSSSVVSLASCGTSYFNRNDTVAVGLCYGENGSPSGASEGKGEHAGVVGVYRPVGTATSNFTIEHDYEVSYKGGEGVKVAAVDKADGSGYTAELKLCFTDAFPAEEVIANGCKMLVQVADSNSTTVAAANGTTFSNSVASYSGSIYIWGRVGHYGANYGALDFEDFVVESIEVVSNPTKIFSVGEGFVIGDTVVKAHYTNGYSEIIPNTDVGVTPYIFTWDDAGATVDVEIFYAGELAVASGTAATNAVATVAEKKLESVEADLTNVDLVYTEGNIFDAAGLVVNAYFLGKGETVAVPSEVTEGYTVTIGAVDGPDALTTELQLGDNVIYVNYGSLSTSFNITVEAKVLENIVVTKAPDKTVYAVGEYLDTTGMEVVAYYNNGDEELVSGYTVDVIGMVGGNESVGAEGKELELTDIFVQVNFGGKSARKPIIVTDGTSADALAYETIDPITVDGKKDGDNAYIGALPVGREGIDAAYGTAYFAYDADYLYVFVEVTDNTIVGTIAGGGGATPATRNDSVIVGLNLAKANTKVTVYDANSVTEQNKYSAWYSATRDKSLASGYYGGHGHSNGGSYIVTREETANGYNVEMRIAWGVDFDAQAKMDAEDVSVWVAINDTTGGIVTSHPLSNTLLTTAGRWAYWHGSDDYQWNKLNAVEVAEISVDATNATVEFEVGDIFSSEGIVLRTEYEDGEFFNSSGFDCRSSIYLGRMFTRPGVFTIELLADDEVVGIYDITVTGDASVATGDDTLAFAPFAAAVAVIALAGVAILFNRKRRQA